MNDKDAQELGTPASWETEMGLKRPATLKDILVEAGEIAKSKGWWDTPRTESEMVSNLHGEVSELWEDTRKGHAWNEKWYEEDGKPCGPLSELADIIIRIGDVSEFHGITDELLAMIDEKQAYNRTRPYRHGGKVA